MLAHMEENGRCRRHSVEAGMRAPIEELREQIVGLLPRLRRFARAIARDPHDADDLVADIIQSDRMTNHGRISAKRAYPQRFREQGDRRRARLLILGGQRSPDDRRDAKHLEQRRGDGTPENPLRITMLGEGEVPAVEGGQCIEAPSALDP